MSWQYIAYKVSGLSRVFGVGADLDGLAPEGALGGAPQGFVAGKDDLSLLELLLADLRLPEVKVEFRLLRLGLVVAEDLFVGAVAVPADHFGAGDIALVEEGALHPLLLALELLYLERLLPASLDVPHQLSLLLQLQVLLDLPLQLCPHLLLQQRHLEMHPLLFYLLDVGFVFFALPLCEFELFVDVGLGGAGQGDFVGGRERVYSLGVVGEGSSIFGGVLRNYCLNVQSPLGIVFYIRPHFLYGFLQVLVVILDLVGYFPFGTPFGQRGQRYGWGWIGTWVYIDTFGNLSVFIRHQFYYWGRFAHQKVTYSIFQLNHGVPHLSFDLTMSSFDSYTCATADIFQSYSHHRSLKSARSKIVPLPWTSTLKQSLRIIYSIYTPRHQNWARVSLTSPSSLGLTSYLEVFSMVMKHFLSQVLHLAAKLASECCLLVSSVWVRVMPTSLSKGEEQPVHLILARKMVSGGTVMAATFSVRAKRTRLKTGIIRMRLQVEISHYCDHLQADRQKIIRRRIPWITVWNTPYANTPPLQWGAITAENRASSMYSHSSILMASAPIQMYSQHFKQVKLMAPQILRAAENIRKSMIDPYVMAIAKSQGLRTQALDSQGLSQHLGSVPDSEKYRSKMKKGSCRMRMVMYSPSRSALKSKPSLFLMLLQQSLVSKGLSCICISQSLRAFGLRSFGWYQKGGGAGGQQLGGQTGWAGSQLMFLRSSCTISWRGEMGWQGCCCWKDCWIGLLISTLLLGAWGSFGSSSKMQLLTTTLLKLMNSLQKGHFLVDSRPVMHSRQTV